MINIKNSNTETKVTSARLAIKILVMAVLVGLFSAVLISGLFYVRIQHLEMQDSLRKLDGEALRIEEDLQSVFIGIERDLMFLSLSAPMRAMIASPGAPRNDNRQHLADLFAAVMEANPVYEQVRYISFAGEGREVVRIDRSDGLIMVTPPERLQSKKMEPYFDIARQIRANEIHFMPITLNREYGKISDPPTPMLRVLIGLSDDAGEKRGFLVINVNFRRVFLATMEGLQKARRLYVVNDRGDYLIHPDPEKAFGFEYGKSYRMGDEFPALADFLSSPETAAGMDMTRRREAIAIGLRKFHFSAHAPEMFWGVGVAASRDALLAGFRQRQREDLNSILAAIAAVAALAGVLTVLLTRPLQRREVEMADHRQFIDLIIANIPDIIFIKDSDLRIVSANDAFLSLYPPGMRDKIIGTTTLEDYPPEQVETFTREDRYALEKGYSQAFETIDFPDGTRRTLFTKKVGFTDNNGRRLLLGVSRDITELKDVEERLVSANADLERFAFIASHDLQEPLRMITNFNGLLAEEYADKLDEDGRMYIEFSVDAASRMQNLISDLLEYSRMQQEGGGSAPIDASMVLDGVLDNLKTAIDETDARITADALPTVHANPMQLSRVFQNLIGNAIKYRDPDRAPEIHVGVKHDDGKFVFSVADNGMGVEDKYFNQIFLLFKRLHSYDKLPGTGLGLAICKKIVEGWGGRIWLQSTPGQGSVFYFSLPEISTGDMS